MPTNTTNIGLRKIDTSTDLDLTVNVDTDFNANWDKIDQKLGGQVVASPAKTPVSLVNGQQVITSPRVAPYNVLSIKGLTRVNLLGRDGGFESISRYFPFQSAIAIDTANYTTGKNGLKVTVANGYASGAGATNQAFNFYAGRKYILLGDVKNGNATGVQIQMTSLLPSGIAVIPLVSDTKWTTVYKKFSPSADSTTSGFNAVVSGAAGTYGYFDSCRIYELSDAEYEAIDTMTPAQVAAKYPYVDDAKPIMNPYMIKHGENLFPTLYECITSSPSPLAIIGPYKGIITSLTANTEWVAANIPAAPNQDYTLSGFGAVAAHTYVHLYDKNGVLTDSFYVPKGSIFPVTFTTKTTTATFQVGIQPTAAGAYQIDFPMVNLGSDALPFKPREDDYLIFPAKLHSNIDRSVYDEITYRDGQYWKNSRFKELELDGTYTWTVADSQVGFKVLAASNIANMYISNNLVIKHDGKILQFAVGVSDGTWSDASAKIVYIGVPNVDSGWADGYTPTLAEIQAYFNGWRMTTQGVNSTSLYDRTDGQFKQWYPVKNTDGSGYVLVLPSNMAGNYTPHKLIYQLATSTTEVIAAEGGITLHEGLNQLEVGAGMIVREKVSLTSDTSYQINIKGHPTIPDSNLSMRLGVLFDIYKNEKPDKAAWTSVKDAYSYGNWRYRSSNADPAAAYTVTYLPLDLYLLTGPVQAIDGEYSSNLKTTVDTLARSQADVLTRVSVLESQKAGKVQPQWITPTLLNGWVAVPNREPQYRRLTDGTVETRGAVKSGVMNAIVFMFPPGYRPGIQTDLPAYSYNGTSDVFGSMNIYPAGGFVANAGSNTFFSIATRFSAEQ